MLFFPSLSFGRDLMDLMRLERRKEGRRWRGRERVCCVVDVERWMAMRNMGIGWVEIVT
jgi:hypothetical protein